jgi:hypothetical protein
MVVFGWVEGGGWGQLRHDRRGKPLGLFDRALGIFRELPLLIGQVEHHRPIWRAMITNWAFGMTGSTLRQKVYGKACKSGDIPRARSHLLRG